MGIKLVIDNGTPFFVPKIARHAALMAEQQWTKVTMKRSDACIHGHFMPYKYRHLAAHRDVRFITWLRDPIQRVVSHYQFCIEGMDQDGVSPFQKKVAREQWSLEAFVEHPYNQNLYDQYFWNFDPNRFDFIGIMENYHDDILGLFYDILDAPRPEIIKDNQSQSIYISDTDVEHISSLNNKDIILYNKARTARANSSTSR